MILQKSYNLEIAITRSQKGFCPYGGHNANKHA